MDVPEGGASPAPGGSTAVTWTLRALVVGVCLVHRGALLASFRRALLDLVAANPDWLTWQLLTVEALRDHLLPSLWWLQQTPPLPNLVMGLVLKLFSWPEEVALALVALQALLTALAGVLLFELGRRLTGSPWPAAGLATAFVLSPDLVVMEYNSFGQTFYESLAMVLVLVAVLELERAVTGAGLRHAALAGGVVGALALTRASYSYYFLVPLLLLVVLRPPRTLARVTAFLAVVAALQGAWCLKNATLYGRLRLATSSWAGGSLALGLANAGLGEPFRQFILEHDELHPEWFVRLVRERGLVHWSVHREGLSAYLPASLRSRDERVNALLAGTNRCENWPSLSALFDQYEVAYRHFAWRHPRLVLRKLHLSYALYWFPIRYHGRQYVDLFCTEWRVERPLRPARTLRQLLEGELPEPHRLTSGTWPRTRFAPVALPTLDRVAVIMDLFGFLAVHLLTPLLLVAVVVRRRGVRGLATEETLLAVAWVTYLYSAVVHNLPEFGENMRFRLSVHPLVWALALGSWVRAGRGGWRALSAPGWRSRPGDGGA